MNEKEKLELDMSKLKEMIKTEVDKAWKDGFSHGAVVTCITLYKTFLVAGLEESNMFFVILKDIAKNHGCADLPAEVAKLSNQKQAF